MSVKPKQVDLRKLMKERRENLKPDKIDSPFAKYNSLGLLFCTICNIQIKNNSLWASHIIGKIHKDNALKKRKGNIECHVNKTKAPNHDDTDMPPFKKPKVVSEVAVSKPQPVENSNKSINKTSLLGDYSSSEESDTEMTDVSDIPQNAPLPKDFFDNVAVNSTPVPNNTPEPSKTAEKSSEKAVSSSSEVLPEGFFDDPVLDAKARNIEYKDPQEEEWERYQKAIAEETNVSKSIMEGDLEESTLERDILQIDEQIHHWQRIKKLESLADDVKTKAPSKEGNENMSSTSDEDLEDDDLLDWRSKGVKKKGKN